MKYIRNFILILTALTIAGCSYSFTGASVPPHLKSIAIPVAKDRSGSGEPTLRDDFTSTLTQYFIEDNTLLVTNKKNADALLDCSIVSLRDAPNIVSGGDEISSRKIVIKVKVIYKDLVKKKTIFDQNFSDEAIYTIDNSGIPRIELRNQAITEAVEKICDNILIGVVSNW